MRKARKPRETHFYSVNVWSYASEEEKRKAWRAETDEEAAVWISLAENTHRHNFYLGYSKPKAVWVFFRAALFASGDPLAFRLFIRFDFDNLLLDLWLKPR